MSETSAARPDLEPRGNIRLGPDVNESINGTVEFQAHPQQEPVARVREGVGRDEARFDLGLRLLGGPVS